VPDIRQSAEFFDDFDRPNEDPLSSGGKWTTTPGFNHLVLKSQGATHAAAETFGDMYWNVETFDDDEAEAWGYQVGGGASGIAWAISLRNADGSGYRFRFEKAAANSRWRIYKDGSVAADSGPQTGNASFTNGQGILLIRRNGGSVEGWAGHDKTDPDTLTLKVSLADSTYTDNLYLSLGITDNSGSQILAWESFGGGALVFIPQIYRRPNE
jgi:hypothetical protein